MKTDINVSKALWELDGRVGRVVRYKDWETALGSRWHWDRGRSNRVEGEETSRSQEPGVFPAERKSQSAKEGIEGKWWSYGM